MNLVDFRIVYINHLFHAPIEKVFDAWLKPELIKKWLVKSIGIDVTDVKIDPKVDGDFLITMRANTGKIISYGGSIQQLERPNLLLFSLEAPACFRGVSLVTVDLQPTKTGCELNFTHTGVEPELVEDGWRQLLENLEGMITGKG